MPDAGHRLLGHALDLALLLARAVGLGSEDAVHLGAQADVLQDPGGEVSPSLCPAAPSPRWPWRAPLPRARSGPSRGALTCRPRRRGRRRSGSPRPWQRVLQLEDLHHHGVGVREEQPHLREEPPHVEVVGLLHHELGELQRAGADLDNHAHAGLAAARLERLHEGQEPLRVVDLELEVRHGALAHSPLELGRVHVGVRVPELVGVLGELHHLLGDHAPRRLELPPLAVLERRSVSDLGLILIPRRGGHWVGGEKIRLGDPSRTCV